MAKRSLETNGNYINDYTPNIFYGSIDTQPYLYTNKNKKLSNEEVARKYVKDIVWTMENPNNKGYNPKTGKYKAYTDIDANGNVHINIGPGLEKNGHPNIDYKRQYTRQELNDITYQTVLERQKAIDNSLRTMQNGRYAIAADTLSMGPRLTMLDIGHNVKTSNKRNMPEKWPAFIDAIANGNLDKAKQETYSGSIRRQKMRNQLLTYKPINGIENYKLGGKLSLTNVNSIFNEDEFKKGGKIYIKPSHRGRLTRLKARTGKSESELYNDGNPAHRKMVVFARNARKWKH